MDQIDAELGFHSTDFHHQIDRPGHDMSGLYEDEAPPISHCEDTEFGESLQGFSDTIDPPLLFSSSCDLAQASEDTGEVILTEEVYTSAAADFETMIAADVTVGFGMAETEETAGMGAEESATIAAVSVDSVPFKRKRGRPRKNPEGKAAPPVKKKEREDVCFVCFDRTNPIIVACNRRGCYKAYHPACVNQDEALLYSKGKWNCGWHICSNCQKAAHYMCYTCTTSYCKECVINESKYVCVRGNHGFCQSCHNTVTLLDLKKLAFENKDGSDVDNSDSFTFLFKAYWLDQKGKLSLSSEELTNARHPFSTVLDEDSSDDLYDANEDQGSSSESSSDHKSSSSSKKKVRGRLHANKNPLKEVSDGGKIMIQETGWASMELLELVGHMRNGNQSFISQFDVQALLLDYIKKYNLRDRRRKSQIICDLRLGNLFGKERVGHFEMLKLLESHFLSKEVPLDVGDAIQLETSDHDIKLADDADEGDIYSRVPEKKRKNRKRTDEIEPQTNVNDYAAIDVHNISLIFLRRSLVEDLLDDIEMFNKKVVGSFVRIRISNAGQRQDLYRLVQIVGTQASPKPYKVGKKTTEIVLEILNLNKKETSSIDSISNQDFTEEECQRLRQSIKCGLIDRLKVGYVQEKAKILHTLRVNDSIESEKLRLSHLRDRASETGRRKELRECVEKLQILNNPEERRRRLYEAPQIHSDPKMDPEYESAEEVEDDKNQNYQIRLKETSSLRKRKELIPRGRAGTTGNWNVMQKSPSFNRESNRKEHGEAWQNRSDNNNMAERPNEPLLHQNKDLYQVEAGFTGLHASMPGSHPPKFLEHQPHGSAPENHLATPEDSFPSIANEVDKIWHYLDPSMNIQGPFSLSQLRKWNATGYFPPDLRTWMTSEKQEDSKMLADVLAGRFYKDLPSQQATQHVSFPNQPTFKQQNRGNWNEHQNVTQPTSPMWSLHGVEASHSLGMGATYPTPWSGNPRPAGPTYSNSYQISSHQDMGRGGNGSGLNQGCDYGNAWSPTRPSGGIHCDIQQVEDNLKSDPSIVYELNGNVNKIESYQSDCPSPTPTTERKEALLRHDLDLTKNWPETLDRSAGICTASVRNMDVQHVPSSVPHLAPNSLTSTANANFELSNLDSSVILTERNSGNGMHHIESTKPISLEQHNKVSSITISANNIGSGPSSQWPELSPIQNMETGFQATDHDQKRLPNFSSAASSLHGMDCSQNPKPNFSPIHQVSSQNVIEAEYSLPSPTPNPSKNAHGTNAIGTPSNVYPQREKSQTAQNANASWPGPPHGIASWGAPAYTNASMNTGLGTLITNVNAGWGIPNQMNANVNPGWDMTANANAGWGTMPHDNANNGWANISMHFDRRRDQDTGRQCGNDPRNISRLHQVSSGMEGQQRGVCKFYENGHCKKGRSCNFLHTDLRRDFC